MAKKKSKARKTISGRKGCRRKVKTSVERYTRCRPGTATRRNTSEERRAKRCNTREPRVSISGHKRKVCRAS